MLVARLGAGLLLAAGWLGSSSLAAAQERPSVRVGTVVLGESVPRVRAALASRSLPGVELEMLEPPAQRPGSSTPDVDLTSRLAAARRAYLDGDSAACLEALGSDATIEAQLAQRRRAAAARLLLWRVACQLAAMHHDEAEAHARALAVYGLDPPDEMDGPVSPDVAELLVAQMSAVREQPRVELRVEGAYPAGVVRLDGSEHACEPPCAFDVVPGDHVLRLDADGLAPSTHRLRVSASGASFEFEPERADPATAAAQWNTRYRGGAVESAASLRLLADALQRPRMTVIVAEEQGVGLRLRGALVEDGALQRRSGADAEDPAGVERATELLLNDLLVSHLPPPAAPLYEEPAFWIVAGVAVLSLLAGVVALTQIDFSGPTRVRFIL